MSAVFTQALQRASAAVLIHVADSEIRLDGVLIASAVWREPHQLALGMVDSSGPTAMVAADAHPEMTRGMRVERAGVEYQVVGIEPDGYGLVTLRLEAV